MANDITPTPAAGPPILDRGAMERVLARAAELSSQSTDAPDGMTEAQLLEIGKEVGLAPATLQQALAEERTRVVLAEEAGFEARFMGPAAISAARAVPHPPDVVLRALEEWMQHEYRLIAKRRFGDRRTWEPRGGVFAELDRTLRGNQAAAALMRATEIGVTVSAIGDGRTAVRLDADLSQMRRSRRVAGITIAAVGVGLSAVPVVLGVLLAPIAMAPLFLGFAAIPFLGMGAASVGMMKGHRTQAGRAQLALEQLLDRLEHGQLPRAALPGGQPPLLAETINAVAQGVRDVARAVQDATAANKGSR